MFQYIYIYNIIFSVGDLCAQNPCLNGGQCYPNNLGGFTCQCPAGYSGQRCEDRKNMILISSCMF